MTATRFRGKVRTIEMCAQNAGASAALVLQTPADFEKGQMLLMTGHGGGGQHAGRAVLDVCPANGAEGVVRAIHEVGTGPTVDMEIDEAGD